MKKQGGQPNNSSGTTTGAQPDASTLLQNLLDSAKEPSFSIDRHYRYTSFNRTHASVMKMIYGMDIRVGMSLLECMTVVQDRETAKKNLDQVLASGDELVAHDYSGEEARSRRYFEVSHRPVKDAPGNMIGVMVTARDITGERQSADKLRESEDKFRSLFMLGPDAFYLATLEDGRFIEVNEGLTKLCGYTRDEMVGRTFLELNLWANLADRKEMLSQLTAKGHATKVTILRRKNGEYVDCQMSVNPITIGKVMCSVGSIADITWRKKAEEELRVYAEQLGMAQEAAGSGFWSWDMTSEKLTWTPQFFKLVGLDPDRDTASFETWRRVLHPDDRELAERKINESIREKTKLENLYRIILPSGTVRWIYALGTTRYDSAGKPVRMAGLCLDITERRQLEQELEKSERRLRSIVETAADAIVTYDESHLIQTWNKAAEKMYGYAAAEIIGRSNMVLIPERMRANSEKGFSGALARGRLNHEGQAFESLALRKDGTEFPVEISISMTRISTGYLFTRIARDITVRKKLEEQHVASEERYHNLIEFAADAIFTYDATGRIITWNRAAEKLYGYTDKEIVGQSKLILLPERMRASSEAGLVRAVASGHLSFADRVHESVALRKNGTEVPVDASLSLTHGTDGMLFTRIARDISDRKRNEEALKQSLALLRSVIDSSADLIYVKDRTLRTTICNQAFASAQGKKPSDMLGKTDIENGWDPTLVKGDPEKGIRGFEQDDLAALGGRTVTINGEPGNVNGTTRFFDTIKLPLKDSGGDIIGMLGVSRDITERKQLENERRRASQFDALGTLAAGIAHDFNNILTGILGNVSLARLVEPRDEREELLQAAEAACQRAAGLTKQLLTFSRGGTPVKKTISLPDLLREATAFNLHGSPSSASFEIAAGLWSVSADQGQLAQVIQNLVINAEQAMPGGGHITIRASNLDMAARQMAGLTPGQYVRVEVADTGTGIPEKYLDRLFEPYFTTKPKGHGLGLSVCHSIITKHGGALTVQSKPGEGTTFTFYLPAVMETKQEATPAGDERVILRGEGRVLLMDDEEAVRKVGSGMLKSMGFEVTLAEHGEQALNLYRQAREERKVFRVVILDLTIPGALGGRETLDRLRIMDPAVKAVVSSGYSDDAAMTNYREAGFLAVIPKPYRLEEMSAALRKALGG